MFRAFTAKVKQAGGNTTRDKVQIFQLLQGGLTNLEQLKKY